MPEVNRGSEGKSGKVVLTFCCTLESLETPVLPDLIKISMGFDLGIRIFYRAPDDSNVQQI